MSYHRLTPEEAASIIAGIDPSSKYAIWSDMSGRYDHSDMYDACATIAALRYEYAAHFRKDGYDFWVGNNSQAPVFKAQAERYEAYAYWDTSREVIERLARQLSERFTVFRRLAGRREVIE